MSYTPKDAVKVQFPSISTPTTPSMYGQYTVPESSGTRNILHDALEITQEDRQSVYGPPKENWERTAKIASAIIGHPISVVDCVKVAIAMKQARLIQSPTHRDSMVDLAGYAWVLSEVSK